MIGIVSFAGYVPFPRIARATVAEALGSGSSRGERAVASYDEDAVTMAVEAARQCLGGRPRDAIRSLFFATTAPPYAEKLNAATVHAALDLSRATRAQDLSSSIRSGTGALLAAADAARAGGESLAALGDVRTGAPESSAETGGGDGAAAFVFGGDSVVAELEATYSETLEFLGNWRLPSERFTKSWEERFALTQAWGPLLASGLRGLLENAGASLGDVTHFVIDAPSPRATASLIAGERIPAEKIVDPRLDTVGHAGSAQVGLMLATALERARPGDRIAVVAASDGVDAFLLRVTEAIATRPAGRSVDHWVASKRSDLSYARFLKWRGILETEPPRRPDPERPAAPPSLRSRRWKFALVGTRCDACGTAQLPPQIVCVQCGASRRMSEVSFADRKATVKTFAVDRLAYSLQPPMVVAVLDFEGGGRVQSELTDVEPEKVSIGDPLEMTFRRLFTAGSVHDYFWKARPVR